MLPTCTVYEHDPQINLIILLIKHITEMVEIFQKWLGTAFLQESELKSETSAAVPHPT